MDGPRAPPTRVRRAATGGGPARSRARRTGEQGAWTYGAAGHQRRRESTRSAERRVGSLRDARAMAPVEGRPGHKLTTAASKCVRARIHCKTLAPRSCFVPGPGLNNLRRPPGTGAQVYLTTRTSTKLTFYVPIRQRADKALAEGQKLDGS